MEYRASAGENISLGYKQCWTKNVLNAFSSLILENIKQSFAFKNYITSA